MPDSQTNLAWDTLLDLDTGQGGPLYERVTQALRTAIRAGTIPNGSALPPSRKLAADLGCSRWVVTEAYGQLLAEGYVEGRVGSGTRVRWPAPPPRQAPAALPRPAPIPQFDLLPGTPDLRRFPRRAWLEALRAELATAPYTGFTYPPSAGHPRLREVLAEYLQRVRGAQVSAEDVTVTTGVADGMRRVCLALVAAGAAAGVVAVEDPGWYRLREVVSGTGLGLAPVPVDGHGLLVDEHGPVLGQAGEVGGLPAPAAVIVTPAHQFPTGAVLAPARRAALVDWARRAGGLILEDDYDAEYRYDRRPVGTVQGMDPRRVALFGSVSKTLAPAMSLGWVVTPPELTRALRSALGSVASPPVLDQLALARFIRSGSYDRHLRAMRQVYRARRDQLVEALGRWLPECPVSGVAAGLHAVVGLPSGVGGVAVVAAAIRHGVRVMDLRGCRLAERAGEPDGDEGLVLGYGNIEVRAIEEAVRRLALAVRDAGSGPAHAAPA
jgi:GntR family transcriptional regulator / MocR family aminotransferase